MSTEGFFVYVKIHQTLEDKGMELVMATREAVPRIMELIEQGKVFLKSAGIDQWQDGYPDQKRIEEDIEGKTGFLCMEEGNIIGYLCVDFNGEPAYDSIDGSWLSLQPYVVVHRLALDTQARGRGFASQIFQLVEKMSRGRKIYSFKIDTDEGNQIMKHLLLKNGFQYCGVICFQNSRKIAYEKLIQS